MYHISKDFGDYFKPILFLCIAVTSLVCGLKEKWPIEIWIPAVAITALFWIPMILDLMTTATLCIEGRKFRIYVHRRFAEAYTTEDYSLDDFVDVVPVGYHFPEARLRFIDGSSKIVSIPYSQSRTIGHIISYVKLNGTVVRRPSSK